MTPEVLKKYQRRLTDLDDTRKRMESLYDNGHLRDRDIGAVYESLFLRAVVGFEEFCEQLFFEILKKRVRYKLKEVSPRIPTCSNFVLRQILLQGKSYLDWLPYDHAERRAKLYLTGGRPFSTLESSDRQMIQTIVIIRNAIAHSSGYSRLKFRKHVIKDETLLASEKSPSGFLRSQLTRTPLQRRFEIYAAELGAISAKICGTPTWCKRR